MTAAYDAQSSSGSFQTTAQGTFTHTPTGTPRGVVVMIAQQGSTGDVVSGVTYGGVAMTRLDYNNDTAGELGGAYSYFLGAGIPTGAQSVVPTVSLADSKAAWCVTVTAGNDTQVAAHNSTAGDAANPSLTLATIAGFAGFCCAGLYSGQNAPASIAAGTNFTLLTTTVDFGNTSGVAERSNTLTGANVVAAFTATSEDVAMVAVAVEEIASTQVPRNPTVNFQDPAWMFKAFRPHWRPRRSGLIVPTPGIARI